jgi:hypothetical protein
LGRIRKMVIIVMIPFSELIVALVIAVLIWY